MNDFTKVGPPDKGDRPRKKSGFFRAIWRGSLFMGLFNSVGSGPFGIFRALAISKTMEVEERVEAEELAKAEAERPWDGLPEAELTKEQEQRAISDEAWRRDHAEK